MCKDPRIENNFNYHAPNEAKKIVHETVRAETKELAYTFLRYCPSSHELNFAFTKLEEAMMWANAAIARKS